MSGNPKDLYKTVILEHNKNPQNYSKREDAQQMVDAYNPVCGDHFKLYFDLYDGKISKLSFHGYGCAISKASASILTDLLEGKTLDEVERVHQDLQQILKGKGDAEVHPEVLLAFEPVLDHPGRLKCVTLCWEALQKFASTI